MADTKGRKGTKPEPKTEEQKAEERYVRDLIARGEAAWPDENGELPPSATHEIIEEREGELPKVRRRRFSAF